MTEFLKQNYEVIMIILFIILILSVLFFSYQIYGLLKTFFIKKLANVDTKLYLEFKDLKNFFIDQKFEEKEEFYGFNNNSLQFSCSKYFKIFSSDDFEIVKFKNTKSKSELIEKNLLEEFDVIFDRTRLCETIRPELFKLIVEIEMQTELFFYEKKFNFQREIFFKLRFKNMLLARLINDDQRKNDFFNLIRRNFPWVDLPQFKMSSIYPNDIIISNRYVFDEETKTFIYTTLSKKLLEKIITRYLELSKIFILENFLEEYFEYAGSVNPETISGTHY